jgi:nicotinamide-nucleotide amidase
MNPSRGGYLPPMSDDEDDAAAVEAETVGLLLSDRGASIAVAESLTGGLLVQALARVEGSGEWLTGGVVAYSEDVKRALLGVTAEKVVSQRCAEEMATGVRHQLHADVAVSVTGVAGPDSQDGQPPGTVWIGLDDGETSSARLFTTNGSPVEICAATVSEALRCVAEVLRGGDGPQSEPPVGLSDRPP